MPSPAESVLSIVQSLANQPELVQARMVDDSKGGYVELKVAPQDRGVVIGHRGRTIGAMRQVIKTAFAKEHDGIDIKLLDS